jgi:antitoxin HicB
MSFTFQIVFRPEPEGGFTVLVPSLPGCVTFGDTMEEAQNMAKEAVSAYLESMKEQGEEIIDDTHTFDSRIQVVTT